MNEQHPRRSTADVLADRDDILDNWRGSNDSMSWSPNEPTSLTDAVGAPQQRGRRSELLFVLEGVNEPLTGVDVEAIGVTIAQIGARFREHVGQYAEAFRQVGERFREIIPAVERAAEIAKQLGDQTATGGALSPRVPAYQDHRPRHESPYGPRRRQR